MPIPISLPHPNPRANGKKALAQRPIRAIQAGMFFDGWEPLQRVLVMSVCAYVALILLLRITGKRTLSKMNAFDLVVTVALGSTLATIILSRETSLAAGVLALAMLILLQYVVAWLSARSQVVDRVVKATPRLVFYRGQMLKDALLKERVSEDEVRAAVREQNIGALEEVEAVVLETSGSFSVIPRRQDAPATALHRVHGFAAHSQDGDPSTRQRAL
jgi:uncharacterized membrane protein YcaP (DUF421 family)